MMKHLARIFFVLTVALGACSVDNGMEVKQRPEALSLDQYPQKWRLRKMTGSIPDSETTGDQMEWQESYLLNSDNTFRKVRERDDRVTEATGTYAFLDLSGEQYLELTYEEDNGLIGTCLTEPKEYLRVIADNVLINTWQACDGPGLEYERIE